MNVEIKSYDLSVKSEFLILSNVRVSIGYYLVISLISSPSGDMT